ncbi:SusC/RagA family TonB-linked outer membrane protein [Terrimonas pollutisoli]|uniref:SusC/RagA family TonB-linked outer membrane protein n=1 Tax=Terrimonas pollutisoli TaxID=3034147 RepID=UPI0023EDE7DC|nr:SusC/RagA family TonB-linked outer membrane protein [Terrimonas sp. H1YJ31]
MAKNLLHPSFTGLFLLLLSFLLNYGFAFSQKKISGLVLDADHQPVDGATIAVKGSNVGTLSAADGRFSIAAGAGDILLVSSVGLIGKSVPVKSDAFIIIMLSFAVNNMEEVVVIGYGTAKKKDLTGAVASVSDKNFNNGIFTSPDQLIQGKVSGVQIINNNGQPGGAITVKIRGNSALSGTGQPLYVVDGVPLDGRSLQAGNNPLNFLNPSDIASIDVLKDASATAIYGSRAAYGVIIINTKKGQTGSTKLDVAISAGVSSVLKKIRVLNAAEYRDAIIYYGVDPSFNKGADVDAMDEILRNGLQQNYSIAGSGGNENGKYRFSVGFLNQDGIVINTGFKKYSADISTNLKLLTSKKLGLDFHLNSSQYFQNVSALNLNTGYDGIIAKALTWNPTDSLKNADGSVKIVPGGSVNPLVLSKFERDNLKVTTLLGSISPYYKFSDWLEYKLLVSINYSSGISRSSVNQALNVYPFFPGTGLATIKQSELTTEQITNTLDFNKEIFEDLHLNAVAGYEFMKFINKGFGLSGNGAQPAGFGNYGLDYTNYVQFSDVNGRSISSFIDPSSELRSFFGRTIFNYKDKYLLTATFRADGSSKFGSNNKYGYFPSFAFAWNISKEKFFKIDLINSLKMRGGWGKTGNQEFPPGSSQALYAFQNNGNIIQINNPNPDLKWQSDRQYNIGIDFSIFNNRITGTMDYFSKTTTNLLFPSPPIQPAPPSSTVRWINLDGEIINKGFEVLINASVIRKEKFTWNLAVNATFLKNNVSGLPTSVYTGDVSGVPVEIIQNGLPMGAFYTRNFLGLDKSTGFSIYEDNGNTFYYVGDPNPKTLLGISSTFRYKKFSLIANMNGSFGHDIYNATLMNFLNVGGIKGGNIALSVYQDPVKEDFANPSQSPSSRYIEKGSYLKMSNLTISYDAGDLAKTFKRTNVYITAQNLFLITKYSGFDPEVNIDRKINGIPSFGIDFARYPSSRSFILGINFSL